MVAGWRTWWFLGLALALGCDGAVPALGGLADGGADGWPAPDPVAAPHDDGAPTITLTGWTRVDDTTVEFEGVATDDARVVALEARVGFSGPYRLDRPDPFDGHFVGQAPVPPVGVFPLTLTAYDAGGRAGTAQVLLDDRPAVAADPPLLTVIAPADGLETNAPVVEVRGTAFSDAGIATVEVNAVGRSFGVVATGDHFRHWARTVPLRPGVREVLRITARDTLGQITAVERVVVSRAAPPHGPPEVVATVPPDGAALEQAQVELAITTRSSAPVTAVEFRVGDGAWQRARGAGDAWVAPLRLAPGGNAIELLVTDEGGLTGLHALTLVNAEGGWADGPVVILRPPGGQGGDVVFDLDRAGIDALFDPALQARTVLFEVDARGLLLRAVRAIRGACGGGCPPSWGPPEQAAWAALTATPADARYEATALGPAAAVADAVLPVPLGVVLAEALDRPVDRPLLDEAALVDALLSEVAQAHPAVRDGWLAVTLADALQGMRPWAARLGPQGDHPGLVDGAVEGQVFQGDVRVRLVARSNVAVYGGVDLAAGQPGFFAAPPPGEPVAELDFQDPERFAIQGLAAQPTVDLTLQLTPAPERAALATALEGAAPAGAAWTLDSALRDAGTRQWQDLQTGCDACAGQDTGALLWRDGAGRVDLAEVAVGRAGYDCPEAGPCPVARPTPAGVPERLRRLTALDCARVEDCAALPGAVCHRSGRDDDRGLCVAAEAVACHTDHGCVGDETCLAGRCVPPERVVCRADAECAAGALCHDGLCRAVPPGWLRLWLIDEDAAPPPAYAWDLVAEVLGAALDDGGRAPARFPLQGLPLGPGGPAVEGALRAALQADREGLAQALLGQLVDQGQRADLYLDRAPDGAVWLLIGGCDRPGEGGCERPSDDSIYTLRGQLLDQRLPDGRTGLPLAAVAAGDALLLRRRQGTFRVDVAAVDDEEVRLWLRGEQALQR